MCRNSLEESRWGLAWQGDNPKVAGHVSLSFLQESTQRLEPFRQDPFVKTLSERHVDQGSPPSPGPAFEHSADSMRPHGRCLHLAEPQFPSLHFRALRSKDLDNVCAQICLPEKGLEQNVPSRLTAWPLM